MSFWAPFMRDMDKEQKIAERAKQKKRLKKK